MKIKIKIINCYYLILVGIMAFQSIHTVYQLSQTIGFGQKISHLQQQKKELSAKKSQLSQDYYRLSSISMIDQEDKDYSPMIRPIIVSGSNSVASR